MVKRSLFSHHEINLLRVNYSFYDLNRKTTTTYEPKKSADFKRDLSRTKTYMTKQQSDH